MPGTATPSNPQAAGQAGDDTAVRRWASLQAGSLPPGPGETPRSVREERDFDLAPAVLASCTEVNSWDTGRAVYTVAMVRDSDRVLLATGVDNGTVQIWDALSGESIRELGGTGAPVIRASWGEDPDGRLLLATGESRGGTRIWDPAAGMNLHELTGHADLISSVEWGAKVRGERRPLLVSISRNGTPQIWDPVTGELKQTLSGTSLISNAALGYRSDGSAVLATAHGDGTVSIWDLWTGRLEDSFTAHSRAVNSVAWGHRPGREPVLATVGTGGQARIWLDGVHVGSSAERTYIELSLDRPTGRCVSWAPLDDGRTLLATMTDTALQIWDGLTGDRLYTADHEFDNWYRLLDWEIAPTGQLLLAAASTGGQIHVWDVVLDPPARFATAPTTALTPRAERGAHPVTILDPPEDVTPGFASVPDRTPRSISRVACTVSVDGHLLAAAMPSGNQGLQIWNLSTGVLLRTIAHGTGQQSASWRNGADGRQLLATGGGDSVVRIWDPDSGQLLHTLTGGSGPVNCTAWGYQPDGRPMLATGSSDRIVRIWDGETGELRRNLAGHTGFVVSAAWVYRPDGPPMLATGSFDNTARIWDVDSAESVHVLTGHTNAVQSVLWGYRADRQPLLVTGSNDGTARIWDPGTGQPVQTIVTSQGGIYALGWATLPDGRQLLAIVGEDGTAEVWDVESGIRLASVPDASNRRQGIALVWSSTGDLLMVVANRVGPGGPMRVWRIATGGSPTGADGPARDRGTGAVKGAGLSRELLRLGRSGLWPPLGLLADLVTLTGPEALDPGSPSDATAAPEPRRRLTDALCDARLAALAVEPGMARLRAVGWEPAARVSMAALLASSLAIPEQFIPPPGVSAQTLRDALARAIAGPGAASAWHAPIGDLRAAVAAISDRAIALLQILGPAACAADPLLPARLAYRIPELPVLTPRELRLLTSAGAGRPATGRETAAGTLRYSPGTAGLARTGPLTRLLPTQLALPRDLLTIRLAENQLLYRQHRAPAPPAPEPVTIILDTTPPTYGPAGNTLRLAAHLMTAALWDHDRYPSLITLGEPAVMTELRTPADLIGIWASSTLDEPAAALAIALATASEVGQPVVFASHFQTARGCGYRPGPVTRLLTAHHPPERPPPPTGLWHRHLPPAPTDAQLTAAISGILSPAAEGGN
jgi:WD40 repeat protein